MNNIIIGNYNNYYNRIHKPAQNTSDEYLNVGAPLTYDRMWDAIEFSNINFNKNDGVNTSLTINVSLSQESPSVVVNPRTSDVTPDTVNPDYLLVCDGRNVVSRWFVLESRWNREWQLVLTLRRDLIADFWDSFSNESFYCEKGPIPSGYDVLKYNSEGMTFNQLLTKRVLLRQSSSQDRRYIVGYIDRSWVGGIVYPGRIYAEYEDFDECPLKTGKPIISSNNIEYGFDVSLINTSEPTSIIQTVETSQGPFVRSSTQYYLHANLSNLSGGVRGTIDAGISQIGSPTLSSDPNDIAANGAALASALTSSGYNLIPEIESDLEEHYTLDTYSMNAFDGQYIKVGDKVYRVSKTYNTRKWTTIGNNGSHLGAAVWNALKRIIPDVWTTGNPLDSMSKMVYIQVVQYTFTEVTSSVVTIPSSRTHAGNLPYDIFVMDDNSVTRDFASNLASQYIAGNVVYDIQVLPFSPHTSGSGVDVGSGNYMFFADSDNVHGTFYHDLIKTYSTSLEYKKGSNMDMCRLYSPDGASCWDFNPAKIGGVAANSIKYEVTFAPFRPYMHIFPTFGGIYGSVNKTLGSIYGESRGLVCTGDYSIPYSTNNWATYQLQNSAYQLAHDRTIENMSISHDAERTQEIVNMIAGTVSGAASGAQSGFFMGGGYGAIAGAVIGGGASLASGIATRSVNDRLRAEEMSYAEDMFGYSLQNIKAQAQPLSHSNYLTVGVAYFPYIELYESTSSEEAIFADRLEVNGWSVGVVTTLSSVKTAAVSSSAYTRFAKGRIVKFGGYEDAHVANEINIELQRGVRFLAG